MHPGGPGTSSWGSYSRTAIGLLALLLFVCMRLAKSYKRANVQKTERSPLMSPRAKGSANVAMDDMPLPSNMPSPTRKSPGAMSLASRRLNLSDRMNTEHASRESRESYDSNV